MSILRALYNLAHFFEFGWWGPVALVLVALGVLAQTLCLTKLHGRKRWLPLVISGGTALVLEIGTDVCVLTQNYLGILFNGILFFVTALLLGAAIPVLIRLYRTKVRYS